MPQAAAPDALATATALSSRRDVNGSDRSHTGPVAAGTYATHAAASMLSTSGPWWRHPMMWLVIGGPAVVVAASVVTLVLAMNHADPVVRTGPVAQAAVSANAEAAAAELSLQPAMKARNHAATGGQEH